MDGGRTTRRVILVGAGHAHLEVLLAARAFRQRGTELCVIDPGRFWYSGLGSAMLAGTASEEADTVDPQRLAASCGATHLCGRVAGLDRPARRLILADGRRPSYDLVSFNVGSTVRQPFPVDSPDVWTVKPIANLQRLRQALLADSRPLTIAVAGGGPTSCELAGNLLRLARDERRAFRVILVCAADRLLPKAPPGASAAAAQRLGSAGAEILLNRRIASVRPHRIVFADGAGLDFDVLVQATGLAASQVMAELSLPTRRSGELEVTTALHAREDARVFAAGDCAAIEGYDLPKIGVYGVRAGPILRDNLLAALDGRPPEAYRPQARYLSILDLGDETGLAMRGRQWRHGRSMLWLKHWLDRRFMRRYQRRYGA